MITLFIDSSRNSLNIALIKSNSLISESTIVSHYKHSNFLMKEIVACLNKNNLEINDINNIVVLNGPGSFTGIRVGVTVSKTLAWALNKKIYSLTTLEALTLQSKDNIVISIISDKSSSGYVGIYKNNFKEECYKELSEIDSLIKDQKFTLVCFDDDEFAHKVYNILSINNSVILNTIKKYNYLDIIDFVLKRNSENPHSVKPVYIKKIDAEKRFQ